MSDLFESTTINSMTLPNRFVRSATWEGLAREDGSVTPRLLEMMAELARGQVGLIISGHAYVSPEGHAGIGQMGVDSDAQMDGLTAMARTVHDEGGIIALQLAHAGCIANFKLSGLTPVGPSQQPGSPCQALDTTGIARLVAAFAQAADRAKRAGFDAVQIHSAHGYFLNQFLSRAWNRRTDAYGGSLENRARLLMEVTHAVRQTVGSKFPVLAKLNTEDFVENGLTIEESSAVALMLEKASVNAVELSGGCRLAGETRMAARKGRIKSPEQEVYYRQAAALCKKSLKIPLMLVGGVRSLEVAGNMLSAGLADYFAMSRPLICEPDLVKRWAQGDRRPAQCLSDNSCYMPTYGGQGLRCVVMEKKRAKTDA